MPMELSLPPPIVTAVSQCGTWTKRTRVRGARFVQLEKIVALMASRLAGLFLRSQAAIKQFIFGMYLKKDVLLSQTKYFAETISCSE